MAAIFIMHIIHNENNVVLILTIQTIYEKIIISEKFKRRFTICNWIFNLTLLLASIKR